MTLVLNDIAFTYEGDVSPVFSGLTAHCARGWTGVVGANGAGKTTLLRIILGEIHQTQGSVQSTGKIIYCPQRTDNQPKLLNQFLCSYDEETYKLRWQLKINDDWNDRWETLSHGERKRAQVAAALWQMPNILLIDEPTNHIDGEARLLLEEALQSFHGVGLLVSHDRALLDALCYQCLFLDPLSSSLRPGTYTQGAQQERRENDFCKSERQSARLNLRRISEEEKRRRTEASHADRQRSKRALARNDSDARAKIDMVRVSGKDGQTGRLARQLQGRVRKAQEVLQQTTIKKEYDLIFWLPGSRSQRDRLFTIPTGNLRIDEQRMLQFPELTMFPDERIAVTGPNGTGKSTLIRHIISQLTLPEEHVLYLPQEIDLATSQKIMRSVHALSRNELGLVMTIVSCLGSRPERLLENVMASPGEIRKILLALGVIRSPHLIIMDEPTNHLDLPAIECLEDALAGCPCGLLLVSHDMRFLSKLAQNRWDLQSTKKQSADIRVGISSMISE